MIRKSAILFVLLLTLGAVVFAQSALTNADVIDLVKSGLSAEIVIAKIKTTNSSFDTSTSALLKLGEAKVPESVVVAMIEKQSQQAEKNSSKAQTNSQSLSKIPEQGSLKDLAGLKKYYVYTEDLKARDHINKEMAKADFTVVDTVEEAEFIITYDEHEDYILNSPRMRQVGTFHVEVRSPSTPGRRRNVYSVKKDRTNVIASYPAQSTTQQFLRELRRALEK